MEDSEISTVGIRTMHASKAWRVEIGRDDDCYISRMEIRESKGDRDINAKDYAF